MLPIPAEAAVEISEIAWMGSVDSANDEWIELHNTGDTAVSVDGWTLQDTSSLHVSLQGTIQPGSYAVLERTDDNSAPGTAFLIYTGALANTGSTLSIYRTDGSLEDRVAGGADWGKAGGDNVTKETAQKTTQGWQTAKATPGSAPDATGVVGDVHTQQQEATEEDDDADDEEVVQIELTLPDVELSLEIVVPEIVYVNQPVSLLVSPSGLGKTQLNSLVYAWNFGDLVTEKGKEVSHTFLYPGTYVVTVHGSFGRHTQVARTEVTVLPVNFSITKDAHGNVQIHNNAKYEVNVSGYTLKGATDLTFPERSILLANGTITVPKAMLGASRMPTVLYDQKGTQVASSYVPPQETSNRVTASKVTSLQRPVEGVSHDVPSPFSFDDDVADTEAVASQTEPMSEPEATTTSVNRTQEARASLPHIPKDSLPLLSLAGIVTLGIAGVFVGRKRP